MSNISCVEARLPPGFRFHPRDDELICDYLMRKLSNSDSLLLIEVDLNKCEPWDIPDVACMGGKDWYFYSHRDRKYATGLRTNRATSTGYWKATGKDRPVLRKGTLVGMRKTLVFYQGRAPRGCKTDWVMHEFRVDGSEEDWVLCRLFNKKGANDRGDVSLPFTDSFIAFEQSLRSKVDDYEQVPCFSIFSQSHQSEMFADWESYTCFNKTPKAENNANLSVWRSPQRRDRRAICPCPACGIITVSKTMY